MIANSTTATNTVDSIGSADLKFTGSPLPTYTTNVAARAVAQTGSTRGIQFDSASSQRGTNGLLTTVTNNFGIELWVRPTLLSGAQTLAHNGVTGNNGWGLRLVDTNYFGVLGGVTNFGVAIAVSNVWMHLALVCQNGTSTLYTNGVSAGSTPVDPQPPATRFGIAGPTTASASVNFFDGQLDEVRVFTFAPGQFSTNDLLYFVNTAPAVTTLAATNVTATSATLNAAIIPGNTATKFYFQYGTNTSYGSVTTTNTLAAGFNSVTTNKAITGLSPGATYHFRVVATNTGGTNAGGNLTFTCLAIAPVATTLPATSIGATNATLNATINPGGAATGYYFEYGDTTNYGSVTLTNTLPAGLASVNVSNLLGGLTPVTVTHYRVVAQNSVNLALGADLTFTNLAAAPLATTEAATDLGTTNATLNATINPGGAATTVYFQYGLTAGYGSVTTTNTLAAGFSSVTTNKTITGLSPGATYHFRVVATNTGGTNVGGNLTFTCLAIAPVATTLPATSIGVTNATLNATLYSGGAATDYYFEYGDTTNYGSVTLTNTLPAGLASVGVSNLLNGLTPGSITHYRVVAENSVDLALGADLTFTNLAAAPLATTEAATDLGTTNATLNATINPGGAATTVYFQYGTNTSYGSLSATNILPAGNDDVSVSQLITGLKSGTNYHFRVIAVNSAGTNAGANLTFTALRGPVPVTLAATSIGASNATLRATVNPGGAATDYYFAYGTTTNYGSFTPTNTLPSGSTAVSVSNVLSGLTPGVKYNFRIYALNSVATNNGSNLAFTNLALVPVVTTDPDSGVGVGVATLNATVNPGGGATKVYFQYGLTTNFGSFTPTNTVAAGFTNVSVTKLVVGLLPNTNYFFRAVASNSGGTNAGTNLTFTTLAATAPTVTTAAATGVGLTDATLNGTVNPNGLATVAWFEWGTTTNYGTLTTTTNLGGGTTNRTFKRALTGLTVATTYFYRAVASNSLGVVYGSAQSWVTATFAEVTASVAPGLPGVYSSSVAWGDYDNDGRLDFLLTGTTNSSTGVSQLWRNTGSGFTNVTASVAPGLPGVAASSVAWGDYDNDGRLDFLLTGLSSGPLVSQLWRNYTPLTHTPPSAPTSLAMTATTNAVLLSWNSAVDDLTPAPGLTYNIRAGTTPGGIDLFAGHVDATSGFRRVPALGNAYLRQTLPLTGLTNGQTVYWSVQAVDTSFAGGPFATETSVVTIPTLAIASTNATDAVVSWTPPTWGWFLQETPAVGSGSWSNSPSGASNPASINTTNAAKFYRLNRP